MFCLIPALLSYPWFWMTRPNFGINNNRNYIRLCEGCRHWSHNNGKNWIILVSSLMIINCNQGRWYCIKTEILISCTGTRVSVTLTHMFSKFTNCGVTSPRHHHHQHILSHQLTQYCLQLPSFSSPGISIITPDIKCSIAGDIWHVSWVLLI